MSNFGCNPRCDCLTAVNKRIAELEAERDKYHEAALFFACWEKQTSNQHGTVDMGCEPSCRHERVGGDYCDKVIDQVKCFVDDDD